MVAFSAVQVRLPESSGHKCKLFRSNAAVSPEQHAQGGPRPAAPVAVFRRGKGLRFAAFGGVQANGAAFQ